MAAGAFCPAPAARESASQTPSSVSEVLIPPKGQPTAIRRGLRLRAGGWLLERSARLQLLGSLLRRLLPRCRRFSSPPRGSPRPYAVGCVLGRGDSNLRMAAPKAAAFPLGDALERHIFHRQSRDADNLADDLDVLGQNSVLHAQAEVAVQSILAARSRSFNSLRSRPPTRSP
jgi:hypothetical protein